MLGLAPKKSLDSIPATNGKSRTAEARSVETAWGEADSEQTMEESSEEEMVESRYEIESRKQHPKKRQRTGTRADEDVTAQTVYTTDEDEDAFSSTHQPRGDQDGISDEEHEYDLSTLDTGGDEGRSEAANRRSYWLSKAMSSARDSGDE